MLSDNSREREDWGRRVRFRSSSRPPRRTSNSTPPAPDYAGFSGRIITAEGADAGNSPNDSVDPWPLGTTDMCQVDPAAVTGPTYKCIKIALGTPNDRIVQSAIPKILLTIFTGDGGITGLLGGDPFTTTVTVPTSGIIAKATITETSGPQTSNFVNSYSSSLDIIDASNSTTANYSPALLSIILRMDAANIAKGTKLSAVAITYDGAKVDPCLVKGVLNSPGVPCINDSKYYKNSRVLGWTLDLDGDMQWTALIDKNGSWTIE